MGEFTCLIIKEVPKILWDEEDVENLESELEDMAPLKFLFLNGHYVAQEVVELDVIKNLVELTYTRRKFFIDVMLMEYLDCEYEGALDEEDFEAVTDNFDELLEEDKIEMLASDCFTLLVEA